MSTIIWVIIILIVAIVLGWFLLSRQKKEDVKPSVSEDLPQEPSAPETDSQDQNQV
jgi:uncharacterized protein YxeA